MARIRSSKPEWWSKMKWCGLPRDIRFTYKGIWEVMVDDEGRFQADPRLVKAAVWPLDDDITPTIIAAWLEEIARVPVTVADASTAPAIAFYESGGIRYGFLPGFVKHQKISHPTPSKLPRPSGQAPERFANPVEIARKELESAQAPAAQPDSFGRVSGSAPEFLRPDVDGEVDPEADGKKRSGISDRRAVVIETSPDPPPLAVTHVTAQPITPAALFANQSVYEFGARFYGDSMPQRKRDVTDQLLATLAGGMRFRGGEYVRAGSLERLAQKCREVIAHPPRDKDSAIVVLLKKLADVSRESPTEAAARNARAEAAADRAIVDAEVEAFRREEPDTYARLTEHALAKYPGEGPMRETIRNAWIIGEIGARRRARQSVQESPHCRNSTHGTAHRNLVGCPVPTRPVAASRQ